MNTTPIQANRALTLLSKMMNLAERWGVRPDYSNPCRHIERYREQRRERFLSSAEITKLGEALATLQREANVPQTVVDAVRLLLLTGARRGEVMRLRWEYLDTERRCVRLPDSKTGAKVVLLSSAALELIARQPRRSEWVFPTEQGDEPVSLSKPWGRIREQAGMLDLRIHDLRHTTASHLAASGASLYLIGKILGHTVPATTARYAHLMDDPQLELLEALGTQVVAALDSIGAPPSRLVSAEVSRALEVSTADEPVPPRHLMH